MTDDKQDLPLAPVEGPWRYDRSSSLRTCSMALYVDSAEFAAMQAMLWMKRMKVVIGNDHDEWIKAVNAASAWQSEAERRYDAAVAAFGEKGEGA